MTHSRASGWTLFTLISLFSGCFETELIPAGAGLGGSGGLSTGGTNAKGGGAGTSGGSATTGGTSATGGISATGGTLGTGGRVSSGGAGGSGGQMAAKIEWLALDGSEAASSLAPNGSLGINGLLYGYGDSCAVLNWNARTRCASGTLCNAENGVNWGVAVGFDFKNTGPTGTPPDTKQVWNPDDAGALGVAWEVTGTAPGLQLWVLNMDPVWSGQCGSVNTCDIAGPPDGDRTAALAGQLLFRDMIKDDWGGSGVLYSYDPAKAYALQFKLPAIVVGPVSFSFCVKSLGIIH